MYNLTYEKALELLAGKVSRKIAHETWLEVDKVWWTDPETGQKSAVPAYGRGFDPLPLPSIAVRYHETNVITIHPDNTYTLNTGGWCTATTKRRMMDLCPAVRFIWGRIDTVRHDSGPWTINFDSQEFYDCITLNHEGRDVDYINPCEDVTE